MSNAKTVARIKSLISNKDVSNEKIRDEIEKLGTDTLTEDEADDVLKFFEQERNEFFKEWKLEIASEYL